MRRALPIVCATLLLVSANLWYSIQAFGADLPRLALFTSPTRGASTMTPLPERSAQMQVNTALFDDLDIDQLQRLDIPDFLMADGAHTLHCSRVQLLAPGATVCTGTADGDKAQDIEKHLVLRGSIDGIDNSFVYLCVFRSYAMGYVEIQEGDDVRRIMIAPDDIRSAHPIMIVYNQRDMPIPPHPGCEAELVPSYAQRAQQLFDELSLEARNGSAHIQNAQTLVAQIAVECDTKYYQEHASNFSQSASYILITLGAVSAVWERDMNIRIQVPFLRIWTENCPYSGDNGAMLNQVATYWNANMQSVRRTTTYLVTSYAGGLAWVNVLCGNYAYAVGGIAGGANFPVSAYAWDVDVMAHELGHNFGSPHTHSCSWAPPVDSCVAAEGGCYAKPLPRPGTIMSYCHLTSFGTQLRFHPRVATLIRSSAQRVLGNCIRNSAQRYSNDCAISTILQPANGAILQPQKKYAPLVVLTNLGLNAISATNSVSIVLKVMDPALTTTYFSSTKTVLVLDTMRSTTVQFDSCSMTAGTYVVTATCTLNNDGDLANNSVTRPLQVGSPSASTVRLTYPNGGERLSADSTVSITWTQSGIDKLIIELSTDEGLSWRSVQTFYSAASLSYQWKVPAVRTSKALLRVVDMKNAQTRDLSDAVFSIDLDNDYQALEFVTPASDTTIGTPFSPKVLVRNNGSQQTAAKAVFELYWRDSGQLVSSDTVDVPAIATGQSAQLGFKPVPELPPGQFIMYAKVKSPGDRYAANDSLGRSFNHVGGIAPPVGLRAQAINKAVLLWWGPSNNSDVESYQLLRSTDGAAFASLVTLNAQLLSYVDENVVNDHVYRYVVVAVIKAQKSISSNQVTARPTYRSLYDSLTSIKALVPENGAKTVPNPTRFVWSSPIGAMWYHVQVSKGVDMSNLVYTGILNDRQPLSLTLDFRQNYCWRVRAINIAGISGWSSVNSFTLGSSCSGNCLNFSATSDNLKANAFTWPADSKVSVEFWNYVKSSDLSKLNVALRVGPDVTTNRFLIHAPYSDGYLYWDYGNINTNGRISVNYRPYLDKWTHVCVVSDGSMFKAIYLDGKLVASSTIADAPTALNGLNLGISYLGRMDEFRVWNRVRSADEIYSSMNKHITPGSNNLMSAYRFDEPLKDTLLGDEGSLQAVAVLVRSAMRAASDAPVNCVSNATLQAPTLLEPANASTVTFPYPNLKWNGVGSVFGYETQISESADFATLVFSIPNCAITSAQCLALRPGIRYYWRVRSLSGAVISDWSAPWSFTTDTLCSQQVPHFDANVAAKQKSFVLQEGEITIEWWNYVDSTEVRNASAFAIGTKDDQNNRCQCTGPWGDKKLYWDYGSLSTGRVFVDYGPYLGKWTHVALVSNARDFQAIYLNGQLSAYELRADSATKLSELCIGQAMNNTNGFKGRMSEFRIWNRVRTQEELQRFMNSRSEAHPNLVGYWTMNEGSGTTLHGLRSNDTTTSLACTAQPQWSQRAVPLQLAPLVIVGADSVLEGSVVQYRIDGVASANTTWTCSSSGTVVAQYDSAGASYVSVRWLRSDSTALLEWHGDSNLVCSRNGMKHVVVLAPSSILVDGTRSMEIYPNPVDNTLSVSLAQETILEYCIVNTRGERVLHVRLPEGNDSQTLSFSCADVPSGSYILQLCTVNARYAAPLLVLH